MDHIYIYFVDAYAKTIEFEIQGDTSYEQVYADTLSLEEFEDFFYDYTGDDVAYTIHIEDEDNEKLKDYFGYDILR